MRSVRRSVFVVASLVAASTLIGQPAGAAPPPTPEVPSGSAAAAATEASTAAPSPADRPIFSLVVSTGANSIVVTSDTPLPDEALTPSSIKVFRSGDESATLGVVRAVFVGLDRRVVELTTADQEPVSYAATWSTTVPGTRVAVASADVVSFAGAAPNAAAAAAVDGQPYVVGAASLSPTSLIVAFSEPMAPISAQKENYVITQENVNPEAGTLTVTKAEFFNGNTAVVKLTTLAQNELTYRVTVANATDVAGNALAPKVTTGGVFVDPTSATFRGTPPTVGVDTDGDGLTDNVEQRGWLVTTHLADGTTATRGVTSDPNVADTDGDGLNDAQEANLRLDPRSTDTDDDQLGDYAEFNEIYSNALSQDSDGDTLDDFLEYTFFHTSPLFADTDGDQINDADEINGNRNPRVSDLPRPEIEVGSVGLRLDVRFSETNNKEHRDLDTKQVTSTLTSSDTKTFTRSDTVNVEAHFDIGTRDGVTGNDIFARGGVSVGYTFQQTSESETSTQQAYERSLTTDREVTQGFTVQRDVQGATMQVAVSLRNVSTLAYRVKNMQVTAFIQDPKDHTRLTPVATLVPDGEPAEGYSLGPLVTNRGPFIFSNTTIIPSLVEALMANSSGLVFRIANYDIIDEAGRNYAFSSREVVERTARLVVDFGGARSLRAQVAGQPIDENQPGDETEIHRVATSAGRAIADTSGDGTVDLAPRELFDADGSSLGFDTNGDGVISTRTSATTAAAWSPDGKLLATAGDDRAVRLWNPATGALIRTITGHPGAVTDVAWSPNGQTLATSSSDATVRLWDLQGDSLAVLTGHTAAVTSVAWSPDGLTLASSSADLTVRLWDVARKLTVRTLTGHTGSVTNVAWSPDGLTLATSSADQLAMIWDAATAVTVRTLAGHVGAVLAVAFSPDGKTVATSGEDQTTRLWSTTLPVVPRLLRGHTASVGSLTWSPDGKTLATGSADRTVRLWNPATGASIRSLGGHAGAVNAIAWSPDGLSLVAAGPATTVDARYIRLWEVATGRALRTLDNHPDDTHLPDTKVVFDGAGKEVGITLHQALAAIGLTRYDEAITPTVALTDAQILSSYSTIMVGGREKIYRIRGVANDASNKTWELLTPLGVDHVTTLDDLVLKANTPVSLNFVQDLDGDGLTADVEFVLRTSDVRKDTDGDGLDDRYEALIGWNVNTPQRSYQVWSSPNRADSNFDDPLVDPNNAYDGSDAYAAPGGWNDLNGNGLRDPLKEVFQLPSDPFDYRVDPVLDPIRRDTDGDGIDDAVEMVGFTVKGVNKPLIQTNPVNPDTDGDTFSDGFERLVGLDPTDATDKDTDGDGLPDPVENKGWTVTYTAVSTAPFTEGAPVPVAVTSSNNSVDTDNDGLTDFEEFFLGTNPTKADTDGDGLDDLTENQGFTLPHKVNGDDLGIIKTKALDADTDNDKRSDGAEAELVDVETARWVVRVDGKAPRQVFSNPLVADADFDSLVDGDEFAAGTDPGNGNTDDDRRADDVEVKVTHTNPLAVDLRVTVVAETVEFAGSLYQYGVSARTPDAAGVAGLSTTSRPVFTAQTADTRTIGKLFWSQQGFYTGKIYFRWQDQNGNVQQTPGSQDVLIGQSATLDPGAMGVPTGATFWPLMQVQCLGCQQLEAAERFTFQPSSQAVARYTSGGPTLFQPSFRFDGLDGAIARPQDVPLAQRSTTFGLAEGQRFAIEGFVQKSAGTANIALGGLEGLPANRDTTAGTSTVKPVFSWDQVADKFIENFYFVSPDGTKVRFYYIIE